MSNGPSVPAPVLPARTLSIMPLPDNAASDCSPCTRSSTASEHHPHPLRSHSTENLRLHRHSKSASSKHSSITKRNSQPFKSSDRPDSFVLNSHRGSIYGSGGDGSYDIDENYVAPPPVPKPVHPAFRNSAVIATEGLNNPTLSGSAVQKAKEYPVVPVRPSLRPTVSFGGESRMSYTSLSSSAMDEKSRAIVAAEKLQHRLAMEKESSGWKHFARFATCGLF